MVTPPSESSKPSRESGAEVSTASDFFDRQSRVFDDEYRTNPGFAERREVWRDLIVRHAKPGGLALDVGCGSGVVGELAERAAMQVTGIDPSPKMLALAAQRLPTATLIEGTIETLAERELSADLVLCSSVLEYVNDLARSISVLAAATRPGGYLIVSLPNAEALYRHVESIVYRLVGRPGYRAHVRHLLTPGSLMARCGLAAVETRYYATHPLFARFGRVIADRRGSSMFATVFRAP